MTNILLILIIFPLLWMWLFRVARKYNFSDNGVGTIYYALVSVTIFVQISSSDYHGQGATLVDYVFGSIIGGALITVLEAAVIVPVWEFIIGGVRNRFGKK